MKAEFTVDGISFIIETTGDDDISLLLPVRMDEEVRLSTASTSLLIVALSTALAEIEGEGFGLN